MGKRGCGEGTIFKDGHSWRCQIMLGRDLETGKVIRATASAKTRQEVQAKLLKLKEEHANKKGISESVVVEKWLLLWMEQYKKNSIKEKTYESYMHLLKKYLIPYLGCNQLVELKTAHIQSMITDMSYRGLSSRTIRFTNAVLHNSLEQALKNEMVIKNVSDAVALPKQNKKPIRFLLQTQQITFIKACKEDSGGLPFILMLATGMRRAEVLGLRWQDIDSSNPSVKVVQSVLRVKDFESKVPKTKIIFGSPKTEASVRTIPVPKSVMDKLLLHKANQENHKTEWQKLGLLYKELDLIFASEVGTPTEPRNLNRKFYKLCEKAGIINMNLHALRHSFATRLLEENEHPKVVQELLGHKSVQLTLDTYSHVSNQLKQDAIEKIGKYF
jgi:integrase